jgi:hypothetical protein
MTMPGVPIVGIGIEIDAEPARVRADVVAFTQEASAPVRLAERDDSIGSSWLRLWSGDHNQ